MILVISTLIHISIYINNFLPVMRNLEALIPLRSILFFCFLQEICFCFRADHIKMDTLFAITTKTNIII
jgi:hypothetical protein